MSFCTVYVHIEEKQRAKGSFSPAVFKRGAELLALVFCSRKKSMFEAFFVAHAFMDREQKYLGSIKNTNLMHIRENKKRLENKHKKQ